MGIEFVPIKIMMNQMTLLPIKPALICIFFLQLIIILPANANQPDSSVQLLCEKPYDTLCSSEEVLKYREEWNIYKKNLTHTVEEFLNSAEADSFVKNIEERQIFFKSVAFDKVHSFLISNISNSQRENLSLAQTSKMSYLEDLGLDSARLETKWNAHYSPQNESIDMGYATFVNDPKFLPIVLRVAAHEFAHAADPSSYFITGDGSNGIFSEKEYLFSSILKDLNSIFPVGYNIECLYSKIKLGARISSKVLGEIKKNKYYKDNSLKHLGCGNGYASEAFSDYTAHRAQLEDKDNLAIRNYVIQQAAHFCSGKKYDPNDTHPSDRDRLEKILFKIPSVKNAMGCRD
ncbi:MAG: hypothetical protein V4654_13360 [Bdellovibrionota bacterium]